MTDIASLNIRINSLEAKMAKQDLDRLTGAGQKTERQMDIMSKAATRLGTALAAAFSTYQMAQFIKTAALAYARFETLGVVMNTVGRNAGYSQREMASFEKSLRESGIAAIEARTVLTRMTQAQIDLTQSSKLARIAQDAAVIGNINSSEAFERMIHGIQSGQVEILRTIGINVNFEQSYKALAEQLGITTTELTETQKAQARVNVVMEAGTRITGVYEASMNTAGKQLASMKRYTDDLKVSIGETFNEALVLLVKQTTLELKGMQNTMKGLKEDGSLSDWGSGFATVVAGTMDIILLVTATITSVTSTISAAIKQLRLVAEAVYDILSLDFAGAKANIKGFAEVGVEWWDKMEKKWTSPTFTDTLRKMRLEAEIASKAFQDTYDMDFGSWADGLEEAGDETDDLSDAAKQAAESLKDLQVQAALESHFADIDNYEDHLKEKEEMAKNAEQSLADIRIQQALDSYFEDIDNYEQHLKEKTDAEEKARKERERKEEKARQEYEREWERVYDDMHRFAADTFYDIFDGQLDSFEDFADSMLDIFKRMLANMAAEAAMTNIFKPLMNQMAGSALGNMLGLPSIPSPTSLLSMGNTAWNAYTGATSHLAYSGLTALGVPGAVGGTAAQSAILAGGGSMAEAASIAGGSIGSSGLAGTIAAAAPWAAMAAVAIPIVMDLFEDEPDFRMGIFAGTHNKDRTPASEKYWYQTDFQDLGDRDKLGNDLIQYFDQRFALLDASTKSDINDIMKSQGDWGQMAWTDPTMYENNQQMVAAIEAAVMRHLSGALVGDIVGEQIAGVFDDEFFQGIAAEGEGAFDTFARFSAVVQNADDFVGEFSRRIDDLGLSSEEAYQQIETITVVMSDMDAAVDTLTSGTATTQLNAMVDTWNAYIDVMRQAQATAEQLTEAESKKNLVVGSQITGLNVNSIAQSLEQGQDISEVVGAAINQLVNEQIAQEMFDEMSPVVEEAGRIWSETGGDIDAVSEYLKEAGYYFGELTDSIDPFVREAELMVAEIIQGGLTASQMFEQWGIENAEAAALLADMTKGRVTEKELEGAVDAFVDLGLEGKDLTTIIGYLANAFVDAANELERTLTGIEDAIGTLPGGDTSADAAAAFRRAFEAFLDFPTLSEIITGGDTEYEITFDEEAYNAALSDAAKDILGDMARDFNYNFGIEGQDQGWWGGESGAEYSVKQMYSAVGIPSSDDVIEYWTNNILSGAYETGLAFSEDFLEAVERDMSGYSSDVLDDLFSKIGAYDLVSEEDFTTREEIPGTPQISSEKDISEALDRLAQFKDADFDIFTDYMDFFDEIRAIQADLGSDVIYDIFGEDTEGIISDITAAYEAYQKALEDAGAEADANTDAENRRLESIQSIVDQAQGYLDQIGMTDLEKTIDDIQKQEADWITQLEDLNASTEDMAVITEWATEKIREAQEAWDLELLNERLNLEAQLYELMEDEAGTAKNLARLRMLELQEMDESLIPLQRRIWLLEDLSDAESSYLEYLQAEIDARQEVYDEAKSVLEDYISDEEALIEARRNASDSINDFIAELMGSSAAPVQSMDFFEGRYAELLEEARTAGPEDIEAAVSNLTGFTSDYLDFAGTYGGDYNTLYNSIIKDLEDLGIDQLEKADDQEDALIDIKDLIGATDEKLFDINEAIQSYVDAKEDLDEASWMRDELDKLQDIDDNLTLLLLAQEKYYALLNRDNVPIDDPDPTTPDPDPVGPDPTIPPEDVDWRAFQEKYGNQISQLWDQYIDFNWDDYTINLPELDIFNMTDMEFLEDLYKNISDYIDRLGLDTTGLDGYASGGIATGPDSGYLAMLHGNEAVIPLNNGYVPVQIQSNSSDDMQDVKNLLEAILSKGDGNNTFIIQIGSREIEDFTVKVLETNPEAHKQIKRVSHA